MKKQIFEQLNGKINELNKCLNGGKGSGNFGHIGRIGQVGGSGDGELKKSYELKKKLTGFPSGDRFESFGEQTRQELDDFETYRAKVKEARKQAKENEKLKKQQMKLTEKKSLKALKAKADKYDDPDVKMCILTTGYTPSEYQAKFKRAWNE